MNNQININKPNSNQEFLKDTITDLQKRLENLKRQPYDSYPKEWNSSEESDEMTDLERKFRELKRGL